MFCRSGLIFVQGLGLWLRGGLFRNSRLRVEGGFGFVGAFG